MKFSCVLILAFFSLVSAVQAQQIDVGANFGIASPVGDFNDDGVGGGASWYFTGHYFFRENISGGIEFGRNAFGIDGTNLQLTMNQFLLVSNFYFDNTNAFRLGGSLGIGTTNIESFLTSTGPYLIFTPRLIGQYSINENIGLNTQLSFTQVFDPEDLDWNHISLRFGVFYRFDL